MEESRDTSTLNINLRGKEVRVLLPARFDYIHGGHAKLITEIQNKFKKVHLVLGLIVEDTNTSLLSLTEKVETLKHFKGIDEIRTLKGEVTAETLKALKVDYVATATASEISVDIPEKVLEFPKELDIDTDEIIIRAIRNYDTLVGKLLNEGYDPHEIGVSKAKVMQIKLKKKLRKLARVMKTKGVEYGRKAEEIVDYTRTSLREFVTDLTEKSENAVAKWASKCGNRVKNLITLAKEGWERLD
ncbi:unnamed protein product [Blepharisma stoltei]|uniref:choline-phosphate cytidylyltransferase n=1 Tax=Blepharisma stoltei TaxID=1481888 RepID=A0AAU9IN59_9CILI|nr:unnamed protein product [Blepharisma stoltei]